MVLPLLGQLALKGRRPGLIAAPVLFLLAGVAYNYAYSDAVGVSSIVSKVLPAYMPYFAVGMLAAVKYLIEELHADVNTFDHEGNTALHHAAARGDVEMINYLVSKGADVKAVTREGKTTADMANGPVQRIQPWPEALALLEKLGSKNNHKCISC